ncbi:MAG TPA: glutaminase, partial [Sporosarcina sp.]|nr:glutaminase [Sporosarcina sp.]
MRNVTNEELEQLVEEARQYTYQGKVSEYIPALSLADKNHLSVAIAYPDGSMFTAGNVHETFTLQSITKVIVLALALMDRGEEYVFQRVGMEPTGDPFNSIVKLETHTPSKPFNPMINAGAIAVTSMIKGDSVDERINRILDLFRKLVGNSAVDYNRDVAFSELATADLNR